jgi:RHS repeat-associated protein
LGEASAPQARGWGHPYDVQNRLTNLTTTQTAGSSPTTVQSYAYVLDEAGRRTQLAEADGTVRAYGYDGIDRLTTEAVTGPLTYSKTFAYDPVGNRTTQTTTGTGADSDTYAYDTRDRLTSESDGTTSYAYDKNGNVTSKSAEATYSWDFENRLTNVGMTASGTSVTHEYDVDGNRVQTSVTSSANATTSNLLVDTTGSLSQVVAETDGAANLTSLYVRVGDELLEVMRPGSTAGTLSTRFVHHDGLGSVRALTDETGTTIDTRGYEAFGTKNVEAGSDPLQYGFAGEPFQPDSMLAYHRARWMDARVGRFEGMDLKEGNPLHPLTLHKYLYVAGSPTNLVDPSGHDPDLVSISVTVTIVGTGATLAAPNLAEEGEAIVAAAEVGEIAAGEVAASATEEVSALAGDVEGDIIHGHHVLSQAFRQWFEAAPRNIDIDQYVIDLPEGVHLGQLHASTIETSVGTLDFGPGGIWNASWLTFILENPTATREQVLDFAHQLCLGFGLSC